MMLLGLIIILQVKLLRSALGAQAVPQPLMDIGTAFAAAADAAFGAKLPVPFSPYDSDVVFYHGWVTWMA